VELVDDGRVVGEKHRIELAGLGDLRDPDVVLHIGEGPRVALGQAPC
jgi:hypothetical protein